MLRCGALICDLCGASKRRIDDGGGPQRCKFLDCRLPLRVRSRAKTLAELLLADFGHDAGKANRLLRAMAVVAQTGKFADVNIPCGCAGNRSSPDSSLATSVFSNCPTPCDAAAIV